MWPRTTLQDAQHGGPAPPNANKAPLYCDKNAQVPIACRKAAPPLLRFKEAGSEESLGGAWVLAKGVPEVLGEHGDRRLGKKESAEIPISGKRIQLEDGELGERERTRELRGEVPSSFDP